MNYYQNHEQFSVNIECKCNNCHAIHDSEEGMVSNRNENESLIPYHLSIMCRVMLRTNEMIAVFLTNIEAATAD